MPTVAPETCAANTSSASSVGAAKLTKIRGEFCLAKAQSSAPESLTAQTTEYKGFGGKKARKMGNEKLAKAGIFIQITDNKRLICYVRAPPSFCSESRSAAGTWPLPQLIDAACGFSSRRRRWWDHQPQPLKEQNGALRRAPPDKLTALALTV